MRRIVLCLLLAALLLVGCGSSATSAPRAAPVAPADLPAAAPTATYDPFATHGCKTCDPQQRRLQATSISR